MTPEQLMALLSDHIPVKNMYMASSGWIRGCCPLHPESNPSWGICTFVPHHPYKCFVCGAGSLIHLFQKVHGCSYWQAAKIIAEYGDIDVVSIKHNGNGQHKVIAQDEFLLAPYEGKGMRLCSLFLGFSEKLLRRFRIGFDSINNRIIFPWFFDGEFVGATGRFLGNSEGVPKTIPYFGLKKGLSLYVPYRKLGKRVILVEGEKDAVSVGRVFPSVAAVGTSSLSPYQARYLLDNCEEVTVIPDNDEAGNRFAESVKKCLGLKMPLFRASLPKRCADPGDATVYDIMSSVSKRFIF